MKKNLLTNVAMIVITLLPAGWVALQWNRIPATVPLHFNLSLQPDRFGPKEQLWTPVAVLAGVTLLLFLLLNNLHRFDPKRRYATTGQATFRKLSIGLVVFLTVVSFFCITASIKGGAAVQSFFYPMLGVMFMMIGNYMHSIKPNYVAGFRLPWTLSDDDNWRKTHRLAGKLWVVAGVMIVVAAFIVSMKTMLWLFLSIAILSSLIPGIYSYKLFKTKSRNASSTL